MQHGSITPCDVKLYRLYVFLILRNAQQLRKPWRISAQPNGFQESVLLDTQTVGALLHALNATYQVLSVGHVGPTKHPWFAGSNPGSFDRCPLFERTNGSTSCHIGHINGRQRSRRLLHQSKLPWRVAGHAGTDGWLHRTRVPVQGRGPTGWLTKRCLLCEHQRRSGGSPS